MDSDLISRDELLELYEGLEGLGLVVPVDVVVQNIRDMPTVDAEPVVHAEWKHSGMSDYYRCTNCGFIPDYNILHGRCPKCDAKMDG